MNLRRDVSNALVALGYRRHERMHHLRLSESFSFWVDTGPITGGPDIAPFVGLRSVEVEDLVSKLMNLSSDEWVGTLGANVGYVLGGDYRSWQSPGDAPEVIAGINQALERLRPHAHLTSLGRAWDIVGREDPSYWYRALAVACLTEQAPDEINRLTDTARSDLCATDDEVCEQFREFESRFVRYRSRV